MQIDLFGAGEQPARPALELLEHASPDYAPRTGENARGAAVTVAFAVDFSTAGERLTARVSGNRYIGLDYGCDTGDAAERLLTFLRQQKEATLNVAGNGLPTLTAHRISQSAANRWVFEVLRQVHSRLPLAHIRSGGQTGIDTAGLAAGLALGVPVTGLYPKGFKRRLATGQDVGGSAEALMVELREQASILQRLSAL